MPTPNPTGRVPARVSVRVLAAVAAVAGLVAGCQAFGGGGGGVMPATDVGLPPSMRGTLPNREARTATVDGEGRPLQTAPSRQLNIPKTAGGATRSAEGGDRRIRRDEIEGGNAGGTSAGSMGPMISPGGSVGLGGKF